MHQNDPVIARRVFGEVGSRLGYTYPTDLDQHMMGYLEKIRQSILLRGGT